MAIGADDMKQQIAGVADTVNRAKGGLQGLTQETEKATVNMKKLSFAVFGASLSVTSIIQQNNRFQRQLTEIEAKQVQIARTEASIATQRLRLTKIIEKFGSESEQAAIAVDRLRASEHSLSVKTKELANQNEDLFTMWITFAVNLSSSVLFSYIGLREALKGVSAATVSATFNTKVFNVTQAASAGFMIRSGYAALGLRGALIGLSAGIKTVLASIPVLGWALLGITTVIEVLMFDIGGLRTGLEKLLGIHKDVAGAASDAGDEFEEFGDIMNKSDRIALTYNERMAELKERLDGVSRAAQSAGSSLNNAVPRRGGGGAGTGGAVGESTATPSLFDEFLATGNPAKLSGFIAEENERSLVRRLTLNKGVRDTMQEIIDLAGADSTKLKIIANWEQQISDIKASAADYDHAEILQREKVISLLKAQIEHQEKYNEKKKKSVDLDKEAVKQAEEFKKKLSQTFGFIRPGGSRFDFIRGLTNFFTGKEGLPFSGVINRRNGGLLLSMQAVQQFNALQDLIEVGEDAIARGQDPLEVASIIEPMISSLLSGRGILAGTSALRDYASSLGISTTTLGRLTAGGLVSPFRQNNNIPVDFSRLSMTKIDRRGFTDAGRKAAIGSGGIRGRGTVGKGGSQSKGRGSKHGGQKGPDLETQFMVEFGFRSVGRNTDYYINLARRNYEAAISLILRAGLPIPSGRFGPGLALAILAQADEARRIIRERERSAVVGGLNLRLSREERFKAHIAEFGIQSVMGGGGTAIQFESLIPLIKAAIADALEADNYEKYWQLALAVKPT